MNEWTVEGLESQLDAFHLGPIDLTLAPGHVTAVLGSSGAGKTTLLRTLAGFLPARAGRVARDGVDLTDRPPEERSLGYVPQGLGLFPHRTVERNVSYPLDVRGRTDALARARELLERFGLMPLARRYPARLSGGEMQRVALARALAAEPDLVLWDEPWQALDVEARFELGRILEELREMGQVPVVVVTHDPALAFAVADSFLVLRGGTPAVRGDAATLLAHPSDVFSARFVGYDNVYDRAELAKGRPGSLPAWLAERSGSEGVAFGRPTLAATAGSPATWEGVVRSARPTPEGFAITLRVDELLVAVKVPPNSATRPPTVGARVRFEIDAASLRPLGSTVGNSGEPP